MAFDYRALRGKIIEIYGTQGEFAKQMKLSENSLSKKLNSCKMWKQSEITKACDLLGIDQIDISRYFFTQKV